MRDNGGITLISLVSSIILILILASMTIVTSMSSYNQMKFEGSKAEIEQVEKLVDEIASDYQTYLSEENNTSKTYQDYFNSRYANNKDEFSGKLLSTNQAKAKTVVDKYSELKTNSNATFYFTQDDLFKYFDLKGINDVVVDFSTRKVYSVEGIKDPDDKDHLYYTSSEWGNDTRVTSENTSLPAVTANSFSSTKSNNFYDVTMALNKKIDVSELYATVNGKISKIVDFRVTTTDTTTTINFVVSSSGNYSFKIIDNSRRVYEIKDKTVNN